MITELAADPDSVIQGNHQHFIHALCQADNKRNNLSMNDQQVSVYKIKHKYII